MARAARLAWLLAWLVPGAALSGPGAAQQASSPAITATPAQVEGMDWYERAKHESARVRLVQGHACADATTARMTPDEVGGLLATSPKPSTPGYVPPARTETVPTAGYPTSQLAAGEPGAASLLIRIDAAGIAEDVRTVCTTDDAFAADARAIALRNRYRAARIGDTPVAAVILQLVTFGVSGD